MLRGLPASIIAHAAVLSASYLTFPYGGSSSRTYATDIQAVDVSFADTRPSSVTRTSRELRKLGLFRGGVGGYRNFTHIDARGFNVDW